MASLVSVIPQGASKGFDKHGAWEIWPFLPSGQANGNTDTQKVTTLVRAWSPFLLRRFWGCGKTEHHQNGRAGLA
jgi:hypothetical protein